MRSTRINVHYHQIFVHRKYRQWWKPTHKKKVWNLTITHTCTHCERILKKSYWLLSRISGRFHHSETNSSDFCALTIHPDNIALCIWIYMYIYRKRSVFMHAYQFIRKIEKVHLLIGFLLRLTIFTWPTKIEYHQIKEPLAVAIMILGRCVPLCALCYMYTLQRSLYVYSTALFQSIEMYIKIFLEYISSLQLIWF